MNSESTESSPAHMTISVPQLIKERLQAGAVLDLDVRPILASGQEPFQQIMREVDHVGPGQVLRLLAPFEPVPLYAVLGRHGFQHWSRQNDSGSDIFWEIYFYREDEQAEVSVEMEDDGGDAVIEIDVRGLEPPEPLERVLEAAEQMAYADVLRVLHHRNPLILFDVLKERGFGFRSEQREDDLWEVRIWRKA